MTAFRKRGLNLERECVSGQVTTEKRSTRFVRATLRHPCSRNIEHFFFTCYPEIIDSLYFERLFCT